MRRAKTNLFDSARTTSSLIFSIMNGTITTRENAFIWCRLQRKLTYSYSPELLPGFL